jgi:hypothetical protein
LHDSYSTDSNSNNDSNTNNDHDASNGDARRDVHTNPQSYNHPFTKQFCDFHFNDRGAYIYANFDAHTNLDANSITDMDANALAYIILG